MKEVKFKICLLGDKGVGKTSVIKRFVHNEFDEDYISSIGTNVEKKEVEVDGKNVLLMHGYGNRDLTLKLVRALAESGNYDILLFGHIHECVNMVMGKCLVVNPGEVFGMLTGKATVAVLDTGNMEVSFLEL